ncbi:MAG: ATP-binding protein [Cyclobacteriaceae bacterium]
MERKLSIPSKIENLRKVEKLIDELSAEHDFHSDLYGNILIATLEAANNAILHGNKQDEAKNVDIVFSFTENELTISVKDKGPGFDYTHVPDPTAPENIENINGRGIFLMEKLSDGIEFLDDGSKVEIKFKLK